ncbi:MAG TPA: putative aminohydrolase SsnA [Verrucomicrobiae bacterium]|nr:putative aminohydrolase SsnA [Verrucomicrobiae bacterium]
MLLKNATLLSLAGSTVERADLRIERDVITAKAKTLKAVAGEKTLDLSGKFVMPGMVCGHTHLYSALARGMPAPKKTPSNFYEILKYVWWTLDRALDDEAVYYSTLVGVLDAVRCGTTTLIDHHASPNFIRGSLGVMGEAFSQVGLRGVLCYEVTDRNGKRGATLGLEENEAWVAKHRGPMFGGLVGAHASFTLSDESLSACADLAEGLQSGVHIHVAEDPCDQADCSRKYGGRLIDRLADIGVLGPKTVLGHCTHLDKPSLDVAREAGCWFAHNTRSNMNNAVGYAPVRWMGKQVALGTDGIGADMFEEVKFAWFKARDARNGLGIGDVVGFLTGAQSLASVLLDVRVGVLEPGGAADLVVLDYPTPTPVTPQNLYGHLIFGMSSQFVTDVMVNGRWVLKNRRVVGMDEERIRAEAQRVAEKVWRRFEKLPAKG